MKLHLAHLAAMREVTAMDDGIHALRLEVFERGGKVFVRPVRPDAVALVRSPKMRVAHDAKNEIRLPAVLPAGRRRENETARQCRKTKGCEGAAYEIPSIHIHAEHLPPCHFVMTIGLMSPFASNSMRSMHTTR